MTLRLTATSKLQYFVSTILMFHLTALGNDGEGEFQSPHGSYQSPGEGGDYAGGGEPGPGEGGPDQGGHEIPWSEGVAPREVLNHDNVKAIYEAILGHEPDPEGHEYWANSGIYTDDLVAALSPAQPHPGEGEYHSPDGTYQSPADGEDYAGGGEPGPGDGGDHHHQPESEGLHIFEVKDFVGQWLDEKEHYQGAKVIWVEKLHDAIDNDGFVYEIGLDNGTSLIFDKDKTFLHSTYSDEFAENEFEEIDLKNTPELVRNSINSVHPEAEITELEMEFSLEPVAEGEEKSFHYLAVIEKDGESFELAINPHGEIIHTHAYEESEFEKNEWKPVELPTVATDFLRENYKDGDSEIPYWIEEREKPNGGKEFVAHLDNDRIVIVDENGTVLEERDLIKERLEKLDAGLRFDTSRSSWGESNGTFSTDANSGVPATQGEGASAFVVIQKVTEDVDEEESPEMYDIPENKGNRYRIALQNRISGEGNASSADYDLSGTDLPAGTEVSLTFTYQMEPPRYFVVSGAELTGFKHRKADWDRPGSFTIKAKTVDPVASQNNAEDSISSTFGILVEMGGERFHQGAIFVTNVIPQDVEGPNLSSPWDPVTGFRLNGLPDVNASVRAYLPKQLLQGHFGIWDPADVKAAITRDDGSLSYLDFQLKPYKGFEPDAFDPQAALEFMFDETMFGLDAKGESITRSIPTFEDPEAGFILAGGDEKELEVESKTDENNSLESSQPSYSNGIVANPEVGEKLIAEEGEHTSPTDDSFADGKESGSEHLVGSGNPDTDIEVTWPKGVARDEILNHDNVKAIYNGVLGQDPDPGGHDFWATSGITTDDLVAELGKLYQPEPKEEVHISEPDHEVSETDPADGNDGQSNSPDGTGTSVNDSTNWNSRWKEALSGYQFTYYRTLSDYTEKIVYTFNRDGTGSMFWNFVSGGITGSGSDHGEENGTWEIIESNQMVVNIRILGQKTGEGYVQMNAESNGKFFIEGDRYYREKMESEDAVFANQRRSQQATNDPAQDSLAGEISVDKSFIDFDGDGYVDSMLEVSLRNASWPAEIQIGDPWIDPFASIDVNEFGTISGTVSDVNGPLRDFGIWILRAQNNISEENDETDDDKWEPVFFDLEINESNGSYIAKVPAGRYYIEASAYDPLTETSYKPLLAGGEDEPRVFEIIDSNSSLSQDFLLEAEYRVSREMGEVSGMVTSGGEPIGGLAIELFPVDENNQSLSDYPVHILFVEPDGKIHGKAPVGTFRGEIVSWDNSFDDRNVAITIEAGGLRELPPIELTKRALATVSGKITDTDGNGVWAEVLFVDPDDEEEMTWPMEFEVDHNESTGFPTGHFSAKLPAGSYKILAQRFDGTLLPAYYTSGEGNAPGFTTAETVQITDAGVSGIDIRLESRPTATVHVQVVDLNNSPVKYAWFLFHDAEDEEGETVFPEVRSLNPFESEDFNGSYVLKVPGGTYKVEVETDGHESAFRILNESGNGAWHNTEWEKGAPVTLTDGNTTTLAKATLKAFEKTEAERFGFAWMEHDEEDGTDVGPLPVGAKISGTVKTKDGTVVPKARIIAHTRDYLLWLDHVKTRADGSFELKNLPARDDWVVFAEPPFDSESFRSFRESLPTDVDLIDSNKTVDLVLQSSNVYGKILFPRKDPATGETRNAPLAHAHVWAYQDDDGDGEPDFDFDDATGSQEPITFNEAFGETDEKGIFSFNLQEAGQYALQIDLPGQLSALRPAPISFNVRNPDRDLNLGNAIRLEWKSSIKATSFDIERKASTESFFRSIFSSDEDKPTAKITSFVDISVKPGKTYKYQVKAETSKGSITLDESSVKVSNPIIYLAPPKKTITGYVFDDSNNTVAGAEIVAWREEGGGWSSILSAADGSFELVAGPGKWEVTVYRPHDVKVDWIYDQEPKRVGFKQGSEKESKNVNFTVNKAAGGKVTGRVVAPLGKTWADIYQYVSVDAFDHEGRGNWTDLDLDSNGSFEIPLQPGNYEVSLWVAPELKGFGSSEIKFARVGKTSVGLEDFNLESRNSKIEGAVTTDGGKALPNVEVWAWSEKGGWSSDVTNVNGAYSLSVSPGQWKVGFEFLPAEDGSAPPYLPAPPKRVKLTNYQSASINFTAKEAVASVKGVVYAAGKAATDIDVWAYARDANTGEGFNDIVAEVPIDSRGKFEFPCVPGEYFVGLWIPLGSGYVNPAEKYLQLDQNGTLRDVNGTALTEIAFNLEANDAVVSGTLKLNGARVTGLSGEVHAAKGDGGGWQTTPIEDNGTFSMTLSPGRWTLGYFIESDEQDRNLPQHPPEPIEVIAKKGETVSKDFSLRSASGTISGSILDENNASITSATVFVWVHREGTGTLDEFWKEVETDADGNFSIPVLPGGKYEVGAFLPDDLREGGYLEPKVKTVDLSANVSGLSLSLGKIVEDNFIKGTIRDDGNTTLDGAYVYAWSDDGRVIEGETDANGSYELKVPKGTVWHVGADYGETDDNGSETIYLAKVELDADLRDADSQSNLNLTLTKPDIKVPEGTNGTFDPSKDFVTKLPDGTEVTIPGGAANVPSTETSVRVVVTPTIKGLTKTAKDQPTSYAYSIELFDSSGKKVEGNFKKDVILKIPVDKNATLAKGLDPDNMEAKFYSTTKNSWNSLKSSIYDSNAGVIYATTDHFTNIATVSNPSISALATGLAKIDSSASGDWYNLPWFGNFYDASKGWVYHETHGWLYSADAGSGNFWFFDAELGWFWTGSTYYDESSTSQAEYLYSSTHAGWLYFTSSNGKRKFYRYSDTKWINADGTEFTE